MLDTLGSLSAFALWSCLAAYAGWHLRGKHERRKRDRRLAALVQSTQRPATNSRGPKTPRRDLQA